MASLILKSYVVINSKDEIVAMDSGIRCRDLVNKLNDGNSNNKPYRYRYIDIAIEN